MIRLSRLSLGQAPNDGTGTPLRDGGQLVNDAMTAIEGVDERIDNTGIGYTVGGDAIDARGKRIVWTPLDSKGNTTLYMSEDGSVRAGDRIFGLASDDSNVTAQVINAKTGQREYAVTTNGGVLLGNSNIEFFDVEDGIAAVVIISADGYAIATTPGHPNKRIPLIGGGLPDTSGDNEGIILTTLQALCLHGQSNAQGVGENVVVTTDQPYGNTMFNGTVRPQDVAANMVSAVPLVESTRPYGGQPENTGGAGETSMSGWANHLVELESIASGQTWSDQLSSYFGWFGGEGGKPIGYFDSGYQGWTNWLARLQRAAAVMAAQVAPYGGTYSYLVTSWQQGEADMNLTAGGATSMQGYLSLLLKIEGLTADQIKVTFAQSWRPLFIIGQMSAHNTYGPTLPDGSTSLAYCNPAIAIAQWQATKQSANIRISNPQYIFSFLNQDPSTTLHLKAEDHRHQGYYFARHTRQLVADRVNRRPLGNYSLEMTSATKTGRRIAVKFNVPSPPIKFDTGWVEPAINKGFEIWAADGVTMLDIIDDIRIGGPDTLWIHTNADIPAGAQIWAGRGRVTDGKGIGRGYSANVPAGARTNLRDSAGDNDHYTGADGVERYMHNWCVIHSIIIN